MCGCDDVTDMRVMCAGSGIDVDLLIAAPMGQLELLLDSKLPTNQRPSELSHWFAACALRAHAASLGTSPRQWRAYCNIYLELFIHAPH